MTSILLAGFAPFGESTTNPSWEAVQRVAGVWQGPETLHIAELPVVFGECAEAVRTLIRRHRPDLVIAVGQAGGRAQITPERIAINIDDARIPDNAGAQPIDVPVVENGPAAYFSTLPIKAMVEAMRTRGIPAAVSNSAGTYACNHVFYAVMHELACGFPASRGGFVHVPFTPDQVAGLNEAKPSMALDMIAEGLAVILRTSLDTVADLAVTAGTEH